MIFPRALTRVRVSHRATCRLVDGPANKGRRTTGTAGRVSPSSLCARSRPWRLAILQRPPGGRALFGPDRTTRNRGEGERRASAEFGKIRRASASFGELRRSESFGERRAPGSCGELWRALASFGELRRSESFGERRGELWRAVASFGELWRASASFGEQRRASARRPHASQRPETRPRKPHSQNSAFCSSETARICGQVCWWGRSASRG